MTSERQNYLISCHLDGSLSRVEIEELEALLAADAEVAAQLAEAARMHVALIYAAKPVTEVAEKPRPILLFTVFAAIAAALVLVGILLTQSSSPTRPLLVQTVGAVFPDGNLPVVGSPLSADVHSISAGAVHLSYPNVADVVIEAPATFQAGEGYTLLLHSGRLTANVIDETSAFTVLTADLEVIDRGTQFAIDAAVGEKPEVHVFEGKVDARARASTPELTSVTAGQAMRLDSTGALVSRSFRNGAFLHSDELERLADGWRKPSRLEEWLEFSSGVETHPQLVSYFRIEKKENGARVDYDSEVHGAKWVQGRWPGQYALDFSEEDDYIRVPAAAHALQTVDELTMMAWVRLDSTPSGFNSIYHTNGWNKTGQVHWMVVNGNTMRLAIRGNSADSSTSTDPYSTSVPLILDFGQWVHLAVVYDRGKKSTRFFVNGEIANEVRDNIAHAAIVGPAQIGNWDSEPRKFSGRLDDLMIFSEAFSDGAVEVYHRQSSPYAPAPPAR
jgi:hypothetical protein